MLKLVSYIILILGDITKLSVIDESALLSMNCVIYSCELEKIASTRIFRVYSFVGLYFFHLNYFLAQTTNFENPRDLQGRLFSVPKDVEYRRVSLYKFLFFEI